jgi:hypothetical protein
MKIKKTFVLPLLALVLPCVYVLPTFAHSAFQPRLSLDSGSGAVCKPVVQISRYHLNFWLSRPVQLRADEKLAALVKRTPKNKRNGTPTSKRRRTAPERCSERRWTNAD